MVFPASYRCALNWETKLLISLSLEVSNQLHFFAVIVANGKAAILPLVVLRKTSLS